MHRKLAVLQEKMQITETELQKAKDECSEAENVKEVENCLLKEQVDVVSKERNVACEKVAALIKERKQWVKEREIVDSKRQDMEQERNEQCAQYHKNMKQLTEKCCKLQETTDILKQATKEKEEQVAAVRKSEKKIQTQLQNEQTEHAKLKEQHLDQRQRLEKAQARVQCLRSSAHDNSSNFIGPSVFKEKLASLQHSYYKSDMKRRTLHAQLVKSKASLRVSCRVSPCKGTPSVFANTQDSSITICFKDKSKSFDFDSTHDSNSSQLDVYKSVEEFVESAIDGKNICIMSLGQRRSGKTHTMIGGSASSTQGIIPRALLQVINTINSLKLIGWEHLIEYTMVELYNGNVRDLLKQDVKTKEPTIIRDPTSIKGQTIRGATKYSLSTQQQACSLSSEIMKSRNSKAYLRSHFILTLYIQGKEIKSSTELNSVLQLVDLAGNERLDKSTATLLTYKETSYVNRSLGYLTEVLEGLALKQKHIPYRNSKLTYWLQPSLAYGQTLVLLHLCPSNASLKDTIRSVKFGIKLKSTHTKSDNQIMKPSVDDDDNDSVHNVSTEKLMRKRAKTVDIDKRCAMSPQRVARKRKSSCSPPSTRETKQCNLD